MPCADVAQRYDNIAAHNHKWQDCGACDSPLDVRLAKFGLPLLLNHRHYA